MSKGVHCPETVEPVDTLAEPMSSALMAFVVRPLNLVTKCTVFQ